MGVEASPPSDPHIQSHEDAIVRLMEQGTEKQISAFAHRIIPHSSIASSWTNQIGYKEKKNINRLHQGKGLKGPMTRSYNLNLSCTFPSTTYTPSISHYNQTLYKHSAPHLIDNASDNTASATLFILI